MKIPLCLLILVSALNSFAQEWKWVGFEIIGNHKISRAELIAELPIKIGEPYKEDLALWQQWCSKIKEKYKFNFAECSSVRYFNFDTFFVLDVVEPGFEYRNKFRPEPSGSIELATPEILTLYEKLYKRLFELFNKNTPPQESADKGYLDYADKEMQNIIQRLVQLVPKYRTNLLEVLEKDKDISKREKAANLLNWTVSNLEDSVIRASRLLDDPSHLIRNNISRFTMHFVGKVTSAQARQGLIDRLLVQLDRPSHADRNKAIYNLLFLAHKFPEDRAYIKKSGAAIIQKIGQASILNNVRDPALDLLKLIEEKK